MSDATKVLQTGVDTGDGSTYPQPVVVVDAAGNPIDLTKANGAAITSVTAVALAAGAAPTATLADGVLTLGIPAGAEGGNGDPGPAGKNGAPGAAGVGVKSITLTKNTSGAITGGTWVGTDDKSHAFTVA
jgi:hypothetical protein